MTNAIKDITLNSMEVTMYRILLLHMVLAPFALNNFVFCEISTCDSLKALTNNQTNEQLVGTWKLVALFKSQVEDFGALGSEDACYDILFTRITESDSKDFLTKIKSTQSEINWSQILLNVTMRQILNNPPYDTWSRQFDTPGRFKEIVTFYNDNISTNNGNSSSPNWLFESVDRPENQYVIIGDGNILVHSICSIEDDQSLMVYIKKEYTLDKIIEELKKNKLPSELTLYCNKVYEKPPKPL